MTRQIVLRKPSSSRRQPLLNRNDPPQGNNTRFAEVAGGTAAECAAVCCCCPCGIMNLLVLAVYKLPAGLCRKALRKKRRKQLKSSGLFPRRKTCPCGCDDTELQIHPVSVDLLKDDTNVEKLKDDEVMELEKEMWEKFYGTGFWRSPSQREENYRTVQSCIINSHFDIAEILYPSRKWTDPEVEQALQLLHQLQNVIIIEEPCRRLWCNRSYIVKPTFSFKQEQLRLNLENRPVCCFGRAQISPSCKSS